MNHPQEPDFLSIVPLTVGYVLTFRGQSIAVNNPKAAGSKVRQILEELDQWRQGHPQSAVAPWMPQPAPPSPGGSGRGQSPLRQAQPMPSQGEVRPGQTDAETGDPPQTIDPAIARQNLYRLVRGRVMGEMTDQEFYTLTEQWCPGVPEDEIVDALDAAFTGEESHDPGNPAAAQAGYPGIPSNVIGLFWGFQLNENVSA